MPTGSAALLCVVMALTPAAAAAPVAVSPVSAGTVRPAAAVAVAVAHPSTEVRQLIEVARVIEQRIALADTVAAAKWPTRGPIDDPAREQVVLDAAADGAIQRGLDPDPVRVIFRDQIEASKVVQYGLFSHWAAVPEDAPITVPDLSQIRPILDQITGQILDELETSHHLRSTPRCEPALAVARRDVQAKNHLDSLHRAALGRALDSVCE
jgi:chorismate mutase